MSKKRRVEDEIRRFVLENFQEGKGYFAKTVMDAVDASKPAVCNILREMKEEGILARRRVVRRWEYFLVDPHDPDEYIIDKQKEFQMSKAYSSLHAQIKLLEGKLQGMEELAKKHEITVPCECGRRIAIHMTTEAIVKDDSS